MNKEEFNRVLKKLKVGQKIKVQFSGLLPLTYGNLANEDMYKIYDSPNKYFSMKAISLPSYKDRLITSCEEFPTSSGYTYGSNDIAAIVIYDRKPHFPSYL